MATSLVATHLLEKLCDLLHDEVVVYGGLQDRVRRIIVVLKSIPRCIRDAENRVISSQSIDESLREFIRRLHLLDNITNTLLVKKEQLRRVRQKSLIKKMCVPSIMRWISRRGPYFVPDEMDEFLTYAKALYREQRQAPGDADMAGRPQLQEPRSKYVNYLEGEDDDSDIVGFKKEADELANKLISSYYNRKGVIAVTGKAGSGKTALTKKVYNKADIKEHFVARAWVSHPEDFCDTELLAHIWTQLNGERKVKNLLEEELKRRVKKILKEKTCLLVIDGICRFNTIPVFLYFIFMGSPRSRIVVVIRKNEMLPMDFTIRLRSLTDEESWTLFMKKANIAEDSWNDHPVLINFKENILRKCNGRPLAIALLGGLLSTRDLNEWSSVIEHPNFQQDILALSYQDLPSKMKSCFLYLGLFPRRSFGIPVRRLLHLWVAEGLVTPLPDEKPIAPELEEDVAEKYFKLLVRRNMIEVSRLRADGSPKMCRVPSSLYDDYQMTFDLLIASFYKYSSSIGRHDPQERGMFLKKVDTYKDFRSSLTVLDLEGVHKPVLPESLGKLLHLKYLGLRRTCLDSLSVPIGDLPSLETLDIKHTRITTLKSSIWNAKNLRHLYMNNIHFHIPFEENTNSSVSVVKLQTLWGLFIGDKCLVENCLNKSIGLRKLGLTCLPTSVEAVSNWVSQLTKLQSLKLTSCDEFGRPSVLDQLGTLSQHDNLTDLYLVGKLPRGLIQLPPKLKILTLSASQLEEDPMPVLGKLHHLNVLRLCGYSYIGTPMTCLADGFPELRVLKLWMLENLKEWNVEQGAMARLRELEIRRCNKLKKVNGLQKVTTLKDIILTNMPKEFASDATIVGVILSQNEPVEFCSF